MNINWKEKGFILGEEACLIKKFYNRGNIIETGIISYIGSKILKVDVYNKYGRKKTLTFNNSIFIKQSFADPGYIIFKSEDDYFNYLNDVNLTIELKDFIKNNICNLNLNELTYISEFIKNNKKQ